MNHKLEANMLRSRKRHKESMHVNTVKLRGAPGHMHATAVEALMLLNLLELKKEISRS